MHTVMNRNCCTPEVQLSSFCGSGGTDGRVGEKISLDLDIFNMFHMVPSVFPGASGQWFVNKFLAGASLLIIPKRM
jgi:hypothetical protein